MDFPRCVRAAAALTGLTMSLWVQAAEPSPFDLVGPDISVTVTRGEQTLPVAQVPNLNTGDRLWIKADLPATQTAHYLLVAAFLRGSTNPPPKEWFQLCETWTPKCRQDGLTVTVPPEAQQMLLFMAPEAGGDFRTLVSAVRGRPGAFVRASQDLNQASLDRARLDEYLAAVRALNDSDPGQLKEVAPLLARSLAIKVDEKCLDRTLTLQAQCLMQGQNSLILNDGHSTSIVEALTTGPASDLAMEASYTPQLSYGYYSPYIASVLDIARIMDSFRTAQYQYIPALSMPHDTQMQLMLNTPPSFHNPKSVLVIALPAVEKAQLPPLHAVDPKETFCARKSVLALPVEGAPLVFSTGYAHDISLRVTAADGKTMELPARADPRKGGYVVDTSPLNTANFGERVRAALHGYWGFDKYDAPNFELVNSHSQNWSLAPSDQGTLIVGRDKTVRLETGNATCLDAVRLKSADGTERKADWKVVKANEVEVTLPLEGAKPGAMTLLVSQYGAAAAQSVALQAFSEAAHLDAFALHAGDSQGLLKGSRLDEVASLTIVGIDFVAGKLETAQGVDTLAMVTRDGQPAMALKAGDTQIARVGLKDGRTIELNTLIAASRPKLALLGKSVQPSASSHDSNIELANQDQLPQDARLTFSVRAQSPATFVRDEKIEVATADEAVSTSLSISSGTVTLEDSRIAVATLDPAKAFGSSVFGPLMFRAVVNGISGDWQPLATLVRLPQLKELKCPATADVACKLSGANLFLVGAVSSDAHFEHSVPVPDGFPGYALPVPHPDNGVIYVRLRDDPTTISRATLNVQQLPPSTEEAARAEVRHAAATAPPPTTSLSAPKPEAGTAAPAEGGSAAPATVSTPAAESHAAVAAVGS